MSPDLTCRMNTWGGVHSKYTSERAFVLSQRREKERKGKKDLALQGLTSTFLTNLVWLITQKTSALCKALIRPEVNSSLCFFPLLLNKLNLQMFEVLLEPAKYP